MGRDRPITMILGLPDTRIPLADKPAPVLDIDLRRTAAHPELRLLIPSLGCSQKIDAVEFTLRQLDRLPLGNHRVRRSRSRRLQLEVDAAERELCRQHLRRERIALAVHAAATRLSVV